MVCSLSHPAPCPARAVRSAPSLSFGIWVDFASASSFVVVCIVKVIACIVSGASIWKRLVAIEWVLGIAFFCFFVAVCLGTFPYDSYLCAKARPVGENRSPFGPVRGSTTSLFPGFSAG